MIQQLFNRLVGTGTPTPNTVCPTVYPITQLQHKERPQQKHGSTSTVYLYLSSPSPIDCLEAHLLWSFNQINQLFSVQLSAINTVMTHNSHLCFVPHSWIIAWIITARHGYCMVVWMRLMSQGTRCIHFPLSHTQLAQRFHYSTLLIHSIHQSTETCRRHYVNRPLRA